MSIRDWVVDVIKPIDGIDIREQIMKEQELASIRAARYQQELLAPLHPNRFGELKMPVRTRGVLRISFPYGEVEMDCNNEPELERAFEMAKHMLKVHEENIARQYMQNEATKETVLPTENLY